MLRQLSGRHSRSGRARLTFQFFGCHCGVVHNGEADKLAKPAMPEAPTPAARMKDLVASLGRQTGIPRSRVTRCDALTQETLGGRSPTPKNEDVELARGREAFLA